MPRVCSRRAGQVEATPAMATRTVARNSPTLSGPADSTSETRRVYAYSTIAIGVGACGPMPEDKIKRPRVYVLSRNPKSDSISPAKILTPSPDLWFSCSLTPQHPKPRQNTRKSAGAALRLNCRRRRRPEARSEKACRSWGRAEEAAAKGGSHVDSDGKGVEGGLGEGVVD